ncbi:hypothetical protein BAUCODRAFT_66527 [Baudoinia panamericana UAMH 10762]|uniref:Protection of telomeres protein 1 n=1 Tax=Baudoinia panamericana (strain UAMH 10762) TaxID=717646 RepID=M2N2N9_BAUPA|nr:uncharacterized protein BAUCODRAFT_66527 [Baudoinia panamericana UAMH 10762]EMC98208.1 hypothetical protein BAUCODRAFT_66527 [Baudoinia panamericana UAMH 10762]
MVPPPGFIDLSTAYKSPASSLINIIGVVVDVMQPRQASTGQYMFTFKLLDPKLQNSIHGSEGLTVRFFNADVSKLPQVREYGDVVLLRNMKTMSFNGQPLAVSNFQTNVQVFPSAAVPAPTYSITYHGTNRLHSLGVPADVEKLTLEEQAYVIQLKADINVTTHLLRTGVAGLGKKRSNEAPPLPAPIGKKARISDIGPKFRLVEELRHKVFSDVVVQVVKKFSNSFGSCELYVTDYTENKDMWYYKPPEDLTTSERDGDDFGYNRPAKKNWPGPYGWLVLKVNLKDPHAQFVNAKISEGDFVILRNVKMKIMMEGAKLEGDMWPDDQSPERVKVVKLMNQDLPEIKELLLRKEKYWTKRRAQHPELYPYQEEAQAKESKKDKKRRKKAEKLAQEEAAAAQAAERNKHVRCSNEEVQLISIRNILDAENTRHNNTTPDGHSYVLPFINAQYRTKAHIVDFEPKALEDFATPAVPENEENDEPSPIDHMDYEATQKYEWYFSLLLEDVADTAPAKAAADDRSRVWVHVRHQDAQYLFGNAVDDPMDLKTSPQLLAKLKEKLCILWGNLEERAEGEVLSNRPFECCLQEYGIQLDADDPERANVPFGYRKLFRLFGTTIL